MKNNILQSNNTFILPDQNKNNKITDNDIKKNQLRITVACKKYFPDYNDILIFEHNKEIYNVKFTNKNCLLYTSILSISTSTNLSNTGNY